MSTRGVHVGVHARIFGRTGCLIVGIIGGSLFLLSKEGTWGNKGLNVTQAELRTAQMRLRKPELVPPSGVSQADNVRFPGDEPAQSSEPRLLGSAGGHVEAMAAGRPGWPGQLRPSSLVSALFGWGAYGDVGLTLSPGMAELFPSTAPVLAPTRIIHTTSRTRCISPGQARTLRNWIATSPIAAGPVDIWVWTDDGVDSFIRAVAKPGSAVFDAYNRTQREWLSTFHPDGRPKFNASIWRGVYRADIIR